MSEKLNDLLEGTDATMYRALASTPQQLADGLDLVRSVLGKDMRDLAKMIDDTDGRDDDPEPRLVEFRFRLLALAEIAETAVEQLRIVAVEVCDA
jgi:hypothetical protein